MQKLEEAICKELNLESINDDFVFNDDNGVDSLARAQIIVLAEETLGRQLTNDQIISMKTYGDLRKFLKND